MRELEHERPTKKPHIQEFVEVSQEPCDWLTKEREYRAEVSKLKRQLKDLKFENKVQVVADEGEKNRLAQANEALKAQIRQMRINADNQQRSRSDERLIYGLKKEIGECRDDLKRSEGTLAQLQVQWAKRTKERTQYLQQARKDYEKTIVGLKRNVATLESKAAKQAKAFETESKHCCNLMASMEGEIQQLRKQHLHDSRVLKVRGDQIERLHLEKCQTRNKILTIASAITRKCRECEDMTRTTFMSALMIFVKRTMYDLEQLERDLAPKPAARPNDASWAPTFGALMYL
ncbi:golgin IMH1-like [Nicotiana sylvestris]|uniref:golgin IMH1-like n=1 Tax=Nicotiana sylvestris TaxID=4096 RepID=UPI00388C8611